MGLIAGPPGAIARTRRMLRIVALGVIVAVALAAAGAVPVTSDILTKLLGHFPRATIARAASAPVEIGTVNARFFSNTNNGTFNATPSTPVAFTQSFQNIDFNDPACVSIDQRPFADIYQASGGCQQVVAQGNGQQAGSNGLFYFQAELEATLQVSQAGSYTFTVWSDDGWILSMGPELSGRGQPTFVSGPMVSAPSSGPFTGYTVMGASNIAQIPTNMADTVSFPAAGSYPIEMDYTESGGGAETVILRDSSGSTPIPSTSGIGQTPAESNGAPPDEHSATCSTSHPVNCATGDFYHSFSDISIPGKGIPINFTRTYNSASAALTGPLGFGWTDSYNVSLTTDGFGNVFVAEETGSTIMFVPTASGYSAPTRVLAKLVKNLDGSYDMTRHDLTVLHFNSLGQLTVETERHGLATTLAYSGGVLSSITDAAGRSLNLSYTNGKLTGISDPVGRTVAFIYDSSGNLIQATDVGQGLTKFTYDSNHLMLTMTDPMNGVLTNTYDASGRVLTQRDPLQRLTRFAWATDQTTITDPNNNVTVQHFSSGELVSVTKASGTPQAATWTYAYDPDTLGVAKVTDRGTVKATVTYDPAGNLLSRTDPLNNTVRYQYDVANEPTLVTDPLQNTEQYTYNAAGDLLTDSQALGNNQFITTSNTYDSAGDVLTTTDPDSKVTTFGYDSAGDRTRTTDPLGDITTSTFDAVGRELSSVSPRGNVTGGNPAAFTTRYVPDAFGNVLSITDPLNHVSTYAYDRNQNLTLSTDANLNQTQNIWDADNERTQTNLADGRIYQTGYDLNGNVVSQTDPLMHATTYTYDPLNRRISATDPLQRRIGFAYDSAGNLTQLTDPLQRTTTMAYNAARQVTSITYSDGTTHGVTFTYDNDGYRSSMIDGTGTTSYSYDFAHRLNEVVSSAGPVTVYTYDLRGEVIKLNYASMSTPNATRTYDDAGRMATVSDWLGNTTAFTYDADGNLTKEAFPNLAHADMTFDNADRLSSITDTGTGGQFLSLNYSRDALGQSTGETPNTYAYDTTNRLTTRNGTVAYGYDAADEITSTPSLTQLQYDAAGELTTTQATLGATVYTFDANGNRTKRVGPSGTTSYSYNQANRLTGAGNASYAYDGDGLRFSKKSGGTQIFNWDRAEGMPLLLQDGAINYVTGPGGMPIEQVSGNKNTVYYYHPDSLGSTRALTDKNGNVVRTYQYDAYGSITSQTGSVSNPLLYTGQYLDAESGLYYLRARYYDPATAQFMSKDSLSQTTMEPYAYANSNPTNNRDPNGHLSLGELWNFLSSVAEPLGLLASTCELIFSAILPLAAFFGATSALLGLVQAANDAMRGNWLGGAIVLGAAIASGAGVFLKFAAAAKEAAEAAAEGASLLAVIQTAEHSVIVYLDLGALARSASAIAKRREIAGTVISTTLDAVGALLTGLSEPSSGSNGTSTPPAPPARVC